MEKKIRSESKPNRKDYLTNFTIVAWVMLMAQVIVVFFIVRGASISDSALSASSVKDYSRGWYMEYRGDLYSLNFPYYGESEADEQIVYFKEIRKSDVGKTVSFLSADKNIEILVDDRVIYSFGKDNTYTIGKSVGSVIVFANIPENSTGKKLKILTSSPYPNYATYMCPITIGPQGNEAVSYISSKIPEISVSMFILIIGFALILLEFMKFYAGMGGTKDGALGVALILLFLYSLIETKIPFIFFGNSFALSNIVFLILMIVPLFFQAYFSFEFVRARVLNSILFGITILNIIVQNILQLSNQVDYIRMASWSHIIIFAVMLNGFVSILYDMIKNRTINNLVPTIGTLIMILAGIMDIYRSKVMMVGDFAVYTRIGALIMGVLCFMSSVIKVSKEQIEFVQEALEKAEAANVAKDRFLANMSHEIRTPINGILGMNEMILKDAINPDVEDYAMNIRRAGETLLSIVNEVLDSARVESGAISLYPVDYQSFTMLNDCIKAAELRIREKGLLFDVKIDSNIPEVLYGDDTRIKQIISNLLTNASKYTHRGKVEFIADCRNKKDDMIDLIFTVKDTGMGIKEEDKQRLFDYFVRLDEDKNRSIEGAGLGLSIVSSLTKIMGGELEVESTYGEGSEFRVIIPQKIVDDTPIGDFNKRSRIFVERIVPSDSIRFKSTTKVLVVDDEPLNLKVVQGYLRDTGLDVYVAGSGNEAISMAKNTEFDLIILDHMMPKPDGIEVFMRLKEFYPSSTPIIMMSANALKGAKEEYLALGFTDYISKPVKENKLIEKLSEYLETYTEVVDQSKNDTQKKDDSFIKKLDESEAIDTGAGLSYAQNDAELYKSMLLDVIRDDRLEEIQDLFNKKDYDGYRIKIHSLKGILAMIGAEELSNEAKDIETNLKSGYTDYAELNHDTFILHFTQLISIIKESLVV